MAFPADEQGIENVWVEPLDSREQANLFRVSNIPLFVYGVCLHDIVTGKRDKDQNLVFAEVIERGGHSTFRIIIEDECRGQPFVDFFQPLAEMGCTYAGLHEGFLAIDVPPHVSIREVIDHLEEGERLGIWRFEEGHLEHKLA